MANTIKSYLHKAHCESMPGWLEQFQKGDRFDRDGFFGSKVVFYPGYGNDGQAVRLFGGSGAAHVFIYADYAVSRERLIARLESADNHFKGYDVLDILNLEQHELVPDGSVTTLPRDALSAASKAMSSVEPFGMITILERKNGFEQDHGPQRLAILFLGADGIATYDA